MTYIEKLPSDLWFGDEVFILMKSLFEL